MELEFDYKNVDWKAVKEKWDSAPMYFHLKIKHGGNEISFTPWLDKSKRYKLGVYVNGWLKGEYTNEGHEFQKYFNPKVILPSKKQIAIERRFDKTLKKLTDRQVIEKQEMPVCRYLTPSFSNISEIKKMVTALE
jgi:hypothetical protein